MITLRGQTAKISVWGLAVHSDGDLCGLPDRHRTAPLSLWSQVGSQTPGRALRLMRVACTSTCRTRSKPRHLYGCVPARRAKPTAGLRTGLLDQYLSLTRLPISHCISSRRVDSHAFCRAIVLFSNVFTHAFSSRVEWWSCKKQLRDRLLLYYIKGVASFVGGLAQAVPDSVQAVPRVPSVCLIQIISFQNKHSQCDLALISR